MEHEALKKEAKRLLHRFVVNPPAHKKVNSADRESLRQPLRDILALISRRHRLNLPVQELRTLEDSVLAEMIGFGPLDDLLSDPGVTDVMINGADEVFVERGGRIVKEEGVFRNNEEVVALLEKMLSGSGKSITHISPFVDSRLSNGARLTAVIPPITSAASICIRKFTHDVLRPETLVENGTFDQRMLRFIGMCVKARLNMLVIGPTGSGKTTLLNTLMREVPDNQRMVVIEETEELSLDNNYNVLKLMTRPPNIDNKGEITLDDLVRLSLHLRPDRIVIGEVRGEETLHLLQAMNTGHEGSMCSLHANGCEDALARLEVLALMAKANLQPQAVKMLIGRGINVIFYLQRSIDSRRQLMRVSEVVYADGDYAINDIFVRQRFVRDEHEASRLCYTGRRPAFMDMAHAITGLGDDEVLHDEA